MCSHIFLLPWRCASDASPTFLTWLVSNSRSLRPHPISILQVHVSFLRFAHIFVCSTIKVMSFYYVFALSVFSFIVLLPHRSLLPHAVLLLLSFLLLSSSICFLLLLSSCSSLKLRILSGTSPSTFRSLCLLPPYLLKFSYSLIFASLSSLFRLMQHGKSQSTCCSFCIFVCFCVNTTTHSLRFFSAFLTHLTTAHNRCDDFFANHFSIFSSTSDSMS